MSETPKPERTTSTPDVLRLRTPSGVELRQMATPEDDSAYLAIQNAHIAHIAEHGNSIYKTEEEVRNSRLRVEALGGRRMGIWDGDSLIGMVGFRPTLDRSGAEMGIWLAADATGRGHATSALRTLAQYVAPRYRTVFAEASPENAPSIGMLRGAGFVQTGQDHREWGDCVVFGFAG